jgi:tetratricopeptide (TPR) repeat protein
MRMSSLWIAIVLGLVLGLLSVPAPSLAQAADPVAANEALEKGLAAAKANQFPLALEYLTAAQKADPDRSDIWFNLGLASSKMPGHEFRAIAFFEAYLLDQPKSPKRAAVEHLLKQLGLPIEARILAMLDELKLMDSPVLRDDWRTEALAGYADRAIKSLDASEQRPGYPVYVDDDPAKGKWIGDEYGRLAFGLAQSGHLAQAEDYLAKYESWVDQLLSKLTAPYDSQKDPYSFRYGVDLQLAYRGLMAAYVRQNDFAKATTLYERFERRIPFIQSVAHDRMHATVTTSLFACAQARSGNKAGAKTTLSRWRDALLADRPKEVAGNGYEQTALEFIAAALNYIGDEQGAQIAERKLSYFHTVTLSLDKNPSGFDGRLLRDNLNDPHEDLRCWLPDQRKWDLVGLGLKGFDLCEGTELDIGRCVAKIRTDSADTEMTRLVVRLSEVYADIKHRGKGWQF